MKKLPVTPSITMAELDTLLRSFYPEARSKSQAPLKEHALKALKVGLGRYLSKVYGRTINMNDEMFTSSNKVLTTLIINSPSKTTQILTLEDCTLLRGHKLLVTDNPMGLLRKVWFELQLHFGVRTWSPREMWPEVFVFSTDPDGREYVHMNPLEIYKAGLKQDILSMVFSRKMYAKGGPLCPIETLKMYMSRRLESVSSEKAPFLLNPNPHWHAQSVMVWYAESEISLNRVRNLMREISGEAHLSKVYTNMSLCFGEYTRYDKCWP